ncbi:MAG: hypothetical protein ACI4YB_01975 [Oscillospiraceae bacterium]
MKKLLLSILACAILFCGCVSDKEYEELKNQVEQYQYELSQKDEQIAQLENKYETYKNSAGIQLSRIREAFFLEKYENVVYLTEQLYENHPDSQEYSAALDLYQTAKIRVANQKKKEQQDREKERKDKMRNTLRIYQSIVSEVDSAGGADIQISWENTSDKTINYITFTVEVYNGVGDLISCEITDKSSFGLKITGPVYSGGGSLKSKVFEYKLGKEPVEVDKFYGSIWENVLYNKTAKKIVIKNILIEYSDDSTVRISDDDLKYLYY